MKCKVAIITAVKVETDSVMRIYDNWEKTAIPGDNQIYYSASFERGGREYVIITAQQNVMGMTAATMLSGKMINSFRPEYLIMCGIAACISPEKERIYGDIMIPNIVWDYSAGKFTVPGTQTINFGNVGFQPRPVSLRLDKSLLEIVRSIQDSTEFKIHIGPMACGSTVIANKEVTEKHIRPFMPETIGLDMESYGVFYAAENSSHPRPKAIVIKSICDYANAEKSDHYQKFAAYTSSLFTKYFIENYLT